MAVWVAVRGEGIMPALRLLLVLLCLPPAIGTPGDARADEGRYSLGVIQPVTRLEVGEGVSASTWLGFYNIDGNAPTTVALTVLSAPSWLDVTLSADGVFGADSVTLTVEPATPTQEPGSCDGPFAREVQLSGRGYVCAETAILEVFLPRRYEGGDAASVTLRATATWAGQGAFRQERDFVYAVSFVEAAPKGGGWAPVGLAIAFAAAGVSAALRRIVKSHTV